MVCESPLLGSSGIFSFGLAGRWGCVPASTGWAGGEEPQGRVGAVGRRSDVRRLGIKNTGTAGARSGPTARNPGAERGGPPQGPARPPSQRKTLPGCALPALRAAGRSRAWGGAGRGFGRVGGFLACADCARTSPEFGPAFRCEPLLLSRRGPRRPLEAGEGRFGIYTACTGTEIRAQSADRIFGDREGWAEIPHTVSTQVRSWNPIDRRKPRLSWGWAPAPRSR